MAATGPTGGPVAGGAPRPGLSTVGLLTVAVSSTLAAVVISAALEALIVSAGLAAFRFSAGLKAFLASADLSPDIISAGLKAFPVLVDVSAVIVSASFAFFFSRTGRGRRLPGRPSASGGVVLQESALGGAGPLLVGGHPHFAPRSLRKTVTFASFQAPGRSSAHRERRLGLSSVPFSRSLFHAEWSEGTSSFPPGVLLEPKREKIRVKIPWVQSGRLPLQPAKNEPEPSEVGGSSAGFVLAVAVVARGVVDWGGRSSRAGAGTSGALLLLLLLSI